MITENNCVDNRDDREGLDSLADGLEIDFGSTPARRRWPPAPRPTAGNGKGDRERLMEALTVRVSARGRDGLREVLLELPDGRRHANRVFVPRKSDGTNYPLEKFLTDGATAFGLSDAYALLWAQSEVIAQAKEADAAAKQAARLPDFPAWTAAELDAAEIGQNYLIPGVLAAGQPMIVGGAPKTLKTTIVGIDMSLSLATGTQFLNTFPVPRSVRVGLMSGESGLATIRETIQRVAGARGICLANVDGLVISDRLPLLSRPDHLDGLARFISEHGIGVLILDPAYMVLPDLNPASLLGVGEALGNLGSVCRRAGVTPVLIHHLRKSRRGHRPPDLHELSGAGFTEFARQWILLGRRESYRPGSGRHNLWLVTGGSAGHSGQWAVDVDEGIMPDRRWRVRIREQTANAAARRRQNRLRADVQAVCRVLREVPAGETPRTIKESAGLPHKRFLAAVKALQKRDKIEACQVQKPNRRKPYDGLKLVNS